MAGNIKSLRRARLVYPLMGLLAVVLLFSLAACGSRFSAPSPDIPATVRAVVREELAQPDQSRHRDSVVRGASRNLAEAAIRPAAGSPALCAGEDPTIKVMPSLVEVRALEVGENSATTAGRAAGPDPDARRVSGSGFIVDGAGAYIITATHVLASADPDSIEIVLRNGLVQPARWVAQEPATDLSVLQTEPTSFPPLKISPEASRALSRSDGADIADEVVELVGLGVIDGAYLTREGLTHSVIVDNAGWHNITVIAPVSPGMSGGPLVTPCGGLVGVITLGSSGFLGTATAIGLDQEILDKLLADAADTGRAAK